MMSNVRLVVAVLLLVPVALACGKSEQQRPVTSHPASPAPGTAAIGTLAPASSPAATATTPPPAAAAPVVSGAARPPAKTPPEGPVTTEAAPPPPPTSDPLLTTHEERPAAREPTAPARRAPQRPKGRISLPAKLGAVTFDHERHASEPGTACATCHHPSRPQKPLASESQACRDCHTWPAVPPMQTSLQAAFHDPKGAAGTCIDCHRKRGGSAPVKCMECHKKK
jgi:Class III cytochrome C family